MRKCRKHSNINHQPSKQDIEEIIECCKSIFNSVVHEDFLNNQNLQVEFFNAKNGVSIYERFCNQYFPSYVSEYHDNYTEDGYMNSFVAQAFVNGNIYGILCSLDADINPNFWYEAIFHEMTHIYCKTHEFMGKDFFKEYCLGEKEESGVDVIIADGYAVWSEFVAYCWGAELDPFSNPLSMRQVREEIRELDAHIVAENAEVKTVVSQMLAHIFRNPDVRNTGSAVTAFELIEKNSVFATKERAKSFQPLITTIFEQLQTDNYVEISPFFMDDLGSAYRGMLWHRSIETH